MISADVKKREVISHFKRAGLEGYTLGQAPPINVGDFPNWSQGNALPYRVYDLRQNASWVMVSADHEAVFFAVASIRQWWETMDHATYPAATWLLITADGGGSNGSRNHLWIWEFQRWADQSGLTIQVYCYPLGTHKWNRIEHRLFSAITQNRRGRPLAGCEIFIQPIGTTLLCLSLTVQAISDKQTYPTRIKMVGEPMAQLHLRTADFDGESNYIISPTSSHKT